MTTTTATKIATIQAARACVGHQGDAAWAFDTISRQAGELGIEHPGPVNASGAQLVRVVGRNSGTELGCYIVRPTT